MSIFLTKKIIAIKINKQILIKIIIVLFFYIALIDIKAQVNNKDILILILKSETLIPEP